MSDYVLFQLSREFRQSLIDGHLFYVRQARRRLLSQFDDIEADADRAAEERLEQLSHHFDSDQDDPGDFYEAAHEAGIEFYGLLCDMREQTCLSVVAGIFHEWEKQLRDWIAREIQHWHRGDNATLAVWSANFDEIVDLLESLGWKVRSADYFRTLDGCRRVVNVYKHGKGNALAKLKENYPEYLDDPFRGSGRALPGTKYLNHKHLKVSEEQFQAFSDAIVAFWRDVPQNVFASQVTDVPDWFGKAIK
jgi:hypothetical protein